MDPVYIGTTSYGRHWLDRPAAESWARMVRDGCPAAGVTDAGRTHEEQIAVFLKYFTTNYATSAQFDQRYWNGQNYWRRQGQPSAATPGTVQARHTFGRALDLNDVTVPTKAWVRANGHRYGWIKDLVRGEDWHMEYQPAGDVVAVSNPGTGIGTVPTVPNIPPLPAPPPPASRLEEDDDMKDLILACYRQISLFTPTDEELDYVQVATSDLTRKDIAPWFRRQAAADRTIDALYRLHLGRPADPQGLAAHRGKTNEAATRDIRDSPEARARRGAK